MPPVDAHLNWHSAPAANSRARQAAVATWRDQERQRDARLPISRWYLRPLGSTLAVVCFARGIAPAQLTWLGGALAVLAIGLLVLNPLTPQYALAPLLLSWLCDRTDGQLARLGGCTTASGAWLDATLDEVVDLGLHIAIAYAAFASGSGPLVWGLLIAFLTGKYLLMHGLSSESSLQPTVTADTGPACISDRWQPRRPPHWKTCAACLYHLPGMADVRFHLLLLALVTGWLQLELAIVAIYYNARWIARLIWVPLRLETPR